MSDQISPANKLFRTEAEYSNYIHCTFNIYAAMLSGYLPPEYLFEHVVSKKLYIFSLGVVVTKIITGPRGPTRRAEMTHQEFTNQVSNAIFTS